MNKNNKINNKRNHLSFIEEMILTNPIVQTHTAMSKLSTCSNISIPFYMNNISLFANTYKIELNPSFDMKYLNEIQKFHTIDFFLLSINSAITLDVLKKYPHLQWNPLGLYVNVNFWNTEFATKIETDVSLLFEEFPNMTYDYDDYTSFRQNPEEFKFDIRDHMIIEYAIMQNWTHFLGYDNVEASRSIYNLIGFQQMSIDNYSRTFDNNYKNVLDELDRMTWVPPNVYQRPLFSKGGINYWNGWKEIESLNDIIKT
jgi:hypothetical protein